LFSFLKWRGAEGVALLRKKGGLWILGDEPMAFPRWINSPNSVGAKIVWHFCVPLMAPCNWWEGCGLNGISATHG